jgi:hypothetical protein
VNDAAATPLKVTAVAPVKLVPVMVTGMPGPPEAGVNDVIVGVGYQVKLVLLVAVPPVLLTVIAPVVPAPTVACIKMSLTTVNDVAAVVPNNTVGVELLKPVPFMLITAPGPPNAGEKDVMVGAC